MSVRFHSIAEQQAEAEHLWWLENRDINPFLFETELEAAIVLLQATPNAGFPLRSHPGVRRYLLSGSRYHVYYSYNPEKDEIFVRAIWSAQRRRSPPVTLLR